MMLQNVIKYNNYIYIIVERHNNNKTIINHTAYLRTKSKVHQDIGKTWSMLFVLEYLKFKELGFSSINLVINNLIHLLIYFYIYKYI